MNPGPAIMNNRKYLFLSLALLCAVCGAAQAAPDIFDGGPLAGKIAAMEVPQPPPAREWTIMVYMNAKNDLEEFGLKDLNEMEMVGSSDGVAVVAELGRIDGYDTGEGDWKGVRRYLVRRDSDTSAITSPVLADLGAADMGDWRNLAGFVKWAKAAYPAKKYMLIVWNHGTGWEAKGLRPRERGISYDEGTGHHIDTPQLGLALKEAGKIDVFATDACLMQMAEVVYELKDAADFIVGSEETEAGDGYTYDAFLGPLAASPDMSPEALAAHAVDAYCDHYLPLGDGSTQSYIRTAELPVFLSLVNDWTAAVVRADLDRSVVKEAVRLAKYYEARDNKDFYNFIELVVKGTRSPEVARKGKALMAFISGRLVGRSRYTNLVDGWWGPVDYSDSHGIAVYLPAFLNNPPYDSLRWAKDSAWREFIRWYN